MTMGTTTVADATRIEMARRPSHITSRTHGLGASSRVTIATTSTTSDFTTSAYGSRVARGPEPQTGSRLTGSSRGAEKKSIP